jgi:archaellum component FlaC
MIEMTAADEFKDKINELRKGVRDIASQVKGLMNDTIFIPANLPKISDSGEMKANIMLSYRCLEDARMRLGKIIQAYDGGTSVYDK